MKRTNTGVRESRQVLTAWLCEAEQAVLSAARAARASGLSLRAIARTLSAKGLRSRTGGEFAAQQVSRMLEAA